MSRDGTCCNCGEPCDGSHSLPVDNNAEIISCMRERTPWGAVPSCKVCHDLHAAAPHDGPKVLDIYEKATREKNEELERFRDAFKRIDSIVMEGLSR